MKRRWIWAAVAFAAVLVLLSQINADAYRPAISAAIESGLGRRVEIRGPMRLNPLRFGFSLEQVVIHEDARFGIEPFAYVSSLDATLRWTALLRGRLEFSRLRFDEPSVNLARSKAGWNVSELLRRTLASGAGARLRMPALEMRGGRLNFRRGEDKSVYYFGDSELRVDPPGENGRVEIYFDGVPVRSDRGLRGFGRLSARGTVDLGSGTPRLSLRLAMERTAVSEILMLAKGQGTGIGGFVSAQATVSGSLNSLSLQGRTQIDEFERWSWMLGSSGGPALNWRGTLDLDAGALQLATAGKDIPVAVQVRGSDIAGASSWGLLLTMRGAPAESVVSLAKELGAVLPPVEASGALDGAVSYDPLHGLRGEFDLSGASFRVPDLPDPAAASRVQLLFGDGRIRILPALFRLGSDAVTLEGDYQFSPGILSEGAAVLRLNTDGIDVDRLKRFGAPVPPWLRSGRWRGNLVWEAMPESTPSWRGEGIVREGQVVPGGAGSALPLSEGRFRIRRGLVESAELAGALGGTTWRADFRRSLQAGEADHLEISLGDITAEKVGAWLVPPREGAGFLERALRGGIPVKEGDRGLQAAVRIARLEWPEVVFSPVTFQLHWTGQKIEISGIQAAAGSGSIQGGLGAELQAAASIKGSLTIHQLPWRNGRVDGRLELAAVPTSVAWTGSLAAAGVELVPGDRWQRLASRVEIRRQDGDWRWRFQDVEIQQAQAGAAILRGHGANTAPGQIQLEMTGPERPQRFVGDLWDGPWEPVR
jgi:hypothetical protein